jgi:hypothetical protein
MRLQSAFAPLFMTKPKTRKTWYLRVAAGSLAATTVLSLVGVARGGLSFWIFCFLFVISALIVNYFRARVAGREAEMVYISIVDGDEHADLMDAGLLVISVVFSVLAFAKAFGVA